MRSFPSSAEVAREAELEKQELAMKRKRSAHEVRIICISKLSFLCHGFLFVLCRKTYVYTDTEGKSARMTELDRA